MIGEETAFEYIRVGARELQAERFLSLEKQMLDEYSGQGYSLESKTPEAEMHIDEKSGQAVLTFVYVFKRPLPPGEQVNG